MYLHTSRTLVINIINITVNWRDHNIIDTVKWDEFHIIVYYFIIILHFFWWITSNDKNFKIKINRFRYLNVLIFWLLYSEIFFVSFLKLCLSNPILWKILSYHVNPVNKNINVSNWPKDIKVSPFNGRSNKMFGEFEYTLILGTVRILLQRKMTDYTAAHLFDFITAYQSRLVN